MIRITGGMAKGRILKVFAHGQVRPTTDKVRQAIFNLLEHRYGLDWEVTHALDLFSGSGSLGLELLSRGGASVTFIEADRKAAGVLKENIIQLATLISPSQTQVLVRRVEYHLNRTPDQVYQLIFADPPYQAALGPSLLNLLEGGWVDDESLVVIEHTKRDLFTPPVGWVLEDRRKYGDSCVSFLMLSPSTLS